MPVEYDIVGLWSEVKVEIVRAYATEYSKIMANQHLIKRHIYIDAFAGPGVNLSRASGEYIPGSPLNALLVQPPFDEFHFIDADGHRTERLRQLAPNHPNVFTYEGDCNAILPEKVFPRAEYKDYARALCLLDPYNIDLSWQVVLQAGRMQTIEIFVNFMIMDINMNVLRRNPERVDRNQIDRMNRFWGDESWRDIAYDATSNLFGWDEKVAGNEAVVRAYRKRLKEVAGFRYVPEPMPMRNSRGATVYYLFFASPNPTGNKIVEHIFNKYRGGGGK
jgi:three-Cys-motif partner protein